MFVKEPIHQRLAAEFRRRITAGEWPEGTEIPSEAKLCAEFGVSRGPVRQALAGLRDDGLITGGQGKAPVVRRNVLSQATHVFVSFSEWAESVGSEPGQQTIEIAKRRATNELATSLQISEGDPVVTLLRLRSLDGEPTMLERTAFVADVGSLLFDFDTDSGSTFRYLITHGVDLFQARHVIDAVAANDVDADALGVAQGTPLLRERRTTSDSAGRILEYAEDRYVSGRANFVIENQMSNTARLALLPSPAKETS